MGIVPTNKKAWLQLSINLGDSGGGLWIRANVTSNRTKLVDVDVLIGVLRDNYFLFIL